VTLLRTDRTDTLVPVGDRAAPAQLDRFVEAMHPGLMGPRLTAALGGAELPCHVLDAKYEPGVRAMLLYRRGGDLLTGELLQDPEPSGVVVAPGVQVLAFPQDQGMPTLARVADRDVLGRALAEAVAPPSYLRARCRTRLLRYRPGKRATFLAALGGDRARYVVKAYHDAQKAAAVAAEAPALSSAASGAGTLEFAPVVAHLPALRVVVQRAVPGRPLDVLLGCAGEPAATAAVVIAARALAEFHGLAAATVRERSVDRELRRFRSRAFGIAAADPRAGEVLLALAERLLIRYQDLPPTRPGLVHGDCTPGQFRLDGGRIFLTDLDHVGLSDQAVDVGTFLASLRQIEIRRLGRASARPGARIPALAASFLETYRQVRAQPVEPARVRWHEAAALERKALRAFARAPRSPLAPTLAAAAHRCLDELEEGR
jgi:Ser/Thr protein kinase RdoA (MazF antagonist)